MKTLLCKKVVWYMFFSLCFLPLAAISSVLASPVHYIEHTAGDSLSGGDESGEKYEHFVLCGRRVRSGSSVSVKVWVLPVVGDFTAYEEHSWTCYGWINKRGKVYWEEVPGDGELKKCPAGKYADTWNNSTGSYELKSELIGGDSEAYVNFHSHCYYGKDDFEASETHNGSEGYCSESGSVNLSISASNQMVPGDTWVEIARRSSTAHAKIFDGFPEDGDRETAYISAQGSNSGGTGSWGWTLKGNY